MASGDVGRIIADANFIPINQIRSAVLIYKQTKN